MHDLTTQVHEQTRQQHSESVHPPTGGMDGREIVGGLQMKLFELLEMHESETSELRSTHQSEIIELKRKLSESLAESFEAQMNEAVKHGPSIEARAD